MVSLYWCRLGIWSLRINLNTNKTLNIKKMIKQKNKTSQGHIEIILSFVIFIGFLLMIFIFFNPIRQPGTSSAALEEVQKKVIDYISTDFDYTSLIMNNPNSITPSCFSVPNSVKISTTAYPIVLDFNNNVLESKISSESIKIEKSSVTGNKLYKVYTSNYPPNAVPDKNFNDYSSSAVAGTCQPLTPADYSFAAVTRDKLVLREMLSELNKSYMINYEALKIDMGITEDFQFIVYDINKNVLINDSLAKHKIKSSNVFSRDVLLNTINKDGQPGEIILGLRVW